MKQEKVALLLELLDESFNRKSWHGPVLLGVLRGVDVDEAQWRPNPKRNSIRDLVYHATYWKYSVRRVLEKMRNGYSDAFARSPANFPDKGEIVTKNIWENDLRLLNDEHKKLRKIVESFSDDDLRKKSPKGAWTVQELIHGVAKHDIYHAGQINFLRRIYEDNKIKK